MSQVDCADARRLAPAKVVAPDATQAPLSNQLAAVAVAPSSLDRRDIAAEVRLLEQLRERGGMRRAVVRHARREVWPHGFATVDGAAKRVRCQFSSDAGEPRREAPFIAEVALLDRFEISGPDHVRSADAVSHVARQAVQRGELLLNRALRRPRRLCRYRPGDRLAKCLPLPAAQPEVGCCGGRGTGQATLRYGVSQIGKQFGKGLDANVRWQLRPAYHHFVTGRAT